MRSSATTRRTAALLALLCSAAACGDGPTAATPGAPEIVFAAAANAQHAGDIYVMAADGSGLTNLTLGPEDHWGPEWLADGRILFRRYLNPGVNAAHLLLTMNADGSDVRPLGVEGAAGGYAPRVSPDARRYAVTARDSLGGYSVYVGAVGGGAPGVRVQKPAPSATDLVMDWSADGSRLAIYTLAPFFGAPPNEPSGYAGVYVINADGTGRRRLTNFPGGTTTNGVGAWSPDARQLAVYVPTSGVAGAAGSGIWLVNTDGVGATQVPGTAGANASLAWAPDGRRLVYNTSDGRLAIVRVPEGGAPTYLPRPAGEAYGTASWRAVP